MYLGHQEHLSLSIRAQERLLAAAGERQIRVQHVLGAAAEQIQQTVQKLSGAWCGVLLR